MNELGRQDSVIVAPGRGEARLYYVPYLGGIERKSATRFLIRYNGGEITVDLRKTEGILFYGATGSLPVEFLDAANQNGVPITFHRTHQAEPYVLTPSPIAGRKDLLTQQILKRQDGRLRMYLARQFCASRVTSFSWLIPIPASARARVNQARSLAALRAVEAEQAAKYWKAYFDAAGVSDAIRRAGSPLATSLDAAGMLVRGILLRWTLHHRLSPVHGFLHEPTGYPSLVFDLIEPYRYLVEQAVLRKAKRQGGEIQTAEAVEAVKEALGRPVYVPATRQWVPSKSLLHGVVLALRAYLSGDMLRFVIPVPGECRPGRPYQTTYRMPAELRQRPPQSEIEAAL
ncbi:MAG: hypothetical protein E6Q76_12950 [Rhizobium sp.]|nr:MAG: hypothetical protein E6Q76_12950 [Rhizobium sp.]